MHHSHPSSRYPQKSSCPNAILWLVLALLIGVLSSDWLIAKVQTHGLPWPEVLTRLSRSSTTDDGHHPSRHDPSASSTRASTDRSTRAHLITTMTDQKVKIYKLDQPLVTKSQPLAWTLTVVHINDSWHVIASERRHTKLDTMVWLATKQIDVKDADLTFSLTTILEEPMIHQWIVDVARHPSLGAMLISLDPGDAHPSNKPFNQKMAWQTMSRLVSPLVPSRAHVIHHLSSIGWMLMQSREEYPKEEEHVLIKRDEIVWISRSDQQVDDRVIVAQTQVDPELWSTDMDHHVPEHTNLNRPVRNFDFIQWLEYFDEVVDQSVLHAGSSTRQTWHAESNTEVSSDPDDKMREWVLSLDQSIMHDSILSLMQHYGLDDRALVIDFSIRCGAHADDHVRKAPIHHQHVMDLIQQQQQQQPFAEQPTRHDGTAPTRPASTPNVNLAPGHNTAAPSFQDIGAIFAMANQAAQHQDHPYSLFSPQRRRDRSNPSHVDNAMPPQPPRRNGDAKPSDAKPMRSPNTLPIHRDIQQAVESKTHTPSLKTCLLASKYIAILRWLKSSAMPVHHLHVYRAPNQDPIDQEVDHDRQHACHHDPDQIWDIRLPKWISSQHASTMVKRDTTRSTWRYAKQTWTINTQLPIALAKRMTKQCPL